MYQLLLSLKVKLKKNFENHQNKDMQLYLLKLKLDFFNYINYNSL